MEVRYSRAPVDRNMPTFSPLLEEEKAPPCAPRGSEHARPWLRATSLAVDHNRVRDQTERARVGEHLLLLTDSLLHLRPLALPKTQSWLYVHYKNHQSKL